MPAAIAGFTPTTPPTSTGSSSTNQMTSGDFLNLMIQQLQQQDPLNPTDSNQLLTQMSQISTLQSNTQMVDSLSALTLQQSIGAGGNLIGKTVTGVDDNGNSQTGVVTGVKVVNKQVRLQLDNNTDLAMANLTQIAAPAVGSLGNLASNPALLQQLLAAAGAGGSSSNNPSSPASTAANNSLLQQLLAGNTGASATPAPLAGTSNSNSNPLQSLASLLSMLGG